MKVTQSMEGVKAKKNLKQTSDGETNSLQQNMKDSETDGEAYQKVSNNQLKVGNMRASGITAVIVLGIIFFLYYYLGN